MTLALDGTGWGSCLSLGPTSPLVLASGGGSGTFWGVFWSSTFLAATVLMFGFYWVTTLILAALTAGPGRLRSWLAPGAIRGALGLVIVWIAFRFSEFLPDPTPGGLWSLAWSLALFVGIDVALQSWAWRAIEKLAQRPTPPTVESRRKLLRTVLLSALMLPVDGVYGWFCAVGGFSLLHMLGLV